MTLVQVRLPTELVKRLDHWCIDAKLTRWQAMEQLITEALDAKGYHWPVKAP